MEINSENNHQSIHKLSHEDTAIWELKQAAKWSSNPSERLKAIRDLGALFGTNALQAVNEVRIVTAYEEVRAACAEVIRMTRGDVVIQRKKASKRQRLNSKVIARARSQKRRSRYS